MYMILKENPYRLAEDLSGVGFKMADEIAEKMGLRVDSEYRIQSGVLYTLLRASSEGHCYLPMDQLLERSGQLLNIPSEQVNGCLQNMVMDKKLVIKGENVYATQFYYAELNCAKMMQELNVPMLNEKTLAASESFLRDRLAKIAAASNMEMDPLQMDAVVQAICNGVFILSGGPGTGKTTTINLMIKYFESMDMDIYLAAPTGRAAKRMSEATGVEASTLHRLLELNGALSDEDSQKVRFERNELNPLEVDVIIVDEMSMVDIFLFQALLKAIIPGTRLILVGDVDQLPSVGPGQVLKDLISSGCFKTCELQKIFRQDKESDIIVNAHRINEGKQIALDNHSKDFFHLERNDANVIYKHMIQLIKDKLPGYVNASPFDIQVLTPMRKGNLGCETLNGILQQYLNPPEKGKKEHHVGDTIYREGDKVMQVKNNYQMEWEIQGAFGITVDKGMGVFNGDMGRILSISEGAGTMVVEFDEHKRVNYSFSSLEELELSYAVTIHKSQGSEYPAVILPILTGPRMLFNRNLLYTGITRAKSVVTILGRSDTVREMIQNADPNRRFTSLETRIREIYGK